MKKRILFLSVVCFTSGCALNDSVNALNDSLESFNNNTAKTNKVLMIDTPLKEMCKEANDNALIANNKYIGKGITLSGVIKDSFSDNPLDQSIFIKSGNILVHVDKTNINTDLLKKNLNVNVTGTINNIKNDHLGCSIKLVNGNIIVSK